MIRSTIPVFRICIYTCLLNLLISTLAIPTSSSSRDDSGSGSGSGPDRFSSQILINGEDTDNGPVISMTVLPYTFSFASLPPIEGSPTLPYRYWIDDISDESQVTSTPSSQASTYGEENDDADAEEVKDEEGMLVTSAEILSGPAGIRCFLFFPYKPFPSTPRSTSEIMSSTKVETKVGTEPDSADTLSYRFTSPIFTSDLPLTYSQSPLPPPSSSTPTRQPLSDPTSERAVALICYTRPYLSPSSYPSNRPTRPNIMPITVILLEYTHPNTEVAINAQGLDQDQDAKFKEERTGGLEVLTLDLYQLGSAGYTFTDDISRGLGRVRGIRRAVVLEQGEIAAENQGEKVVCRFEKGDRVAETRDTDLLWGIVDAEGEDDGWGSDASTSGSEWEWDREDEVEEGSEDESSLPSFSLNEAIQTTVHNVKGVVCAYE